MQECDVLKGSEIISRLTEKNKNLWEDLSVALAAGHFWPAVSRYQGHP
jgi:hypothetical protein